MLNIVEEPKGTSINVFLALQALQGASCRSLVFSVCDALRDAVLRAKGRKAPPGERGSMGTLQSTQRLVVLLQQQEEEMNSWRVSIHSQIIQNSTS